MQINKNIEKILKEQKRIAVVGASDNPLRDSHRVTRFMIEQGYQVFPVNPKLTELLGVMFYPALSQIPESIDVVDIFRRSEFVDPIVEEAIKIGAKTVWMQLGVENPAAAQKAIDAGLNVVMNRCWKIEYQNMSNRKV